MGEFGEGGPSLKKMWISNEGIEGEKASALDRVITEPDFTWDKPHSDHSRASVREYFRTLPHEMDSLRDAKTTILTPEQQGHLPQYESLIEQRLQLLEEWRELDRQIREEEEKLHYSDVNSEKNLAIKGMREQGLRVDIFEEFPFDPETGKLMSLEAVEVAIQNQVKKYGKIRVDSSDIERYRREYPAIRENRVAFEDYLRVEKALRPLLQKRQQLYRRSGELALQSVKQWYAIFPSE